MIVQAPAPSQCGGGGGAAALGAEGVCWFHQEHAKQYSKQEEIEKETIVIVVRSTSRVISVLCVSGSCYHSSGAFYTSGGSGSTMIVVVEYRRQSRVVGVVLGVVLIIIIAHLVMLILLASITSQVRIKVHQQLLALAVLCIYYVTLSYQQYLVVVLSISISYQQYHYVRILNRNTYQIICVADAHTLLNIQSQYTKRTSYIIDAQTPPFK